MNTTTKALFFSIGALLCSVAGCTDDFSRFHFQKKPTKTRDSGMPNMSDATTNDTDGGPGETAAQSE